MNNKFWSLLRVALGFVFLWAFLDKLFGLGYATKEAASWLNGGSPTAGFLSFGTTGPLADFYKGLSGSALVDWLFMLGLLGIGFSFVFGIGMKFMGWIGALLMVMMWSAVQPLKNNPLIDDHIIYALLLICLGRSDVADGMSFRTAWRNTAFVQKHPWLA